MLGLTDMQSRIRRLEELSRGLTREVAVWRPGEDPLLYLERREYLNAIQDALAGFESARVVMARAVQRLRRAEAPREPAAVDEGEAP